MENEIRQLIFTFISDNYSVDQADLTNDLDLVKNEVLDSMGIVELVSYIEGEFGIVVGDEDITVDNFGKIEAILSYVKERVDH